MFYGFTAAWLIVLIYVISLARRGARLKKQLEDVQHIVESSKSANSPKLEQRLR